MEKITNQAITDTLALPATGPAVTIYIPLHGSAAPPHVSQDQITIKNCIHDAIERATSLPNHEAVIQTLHQQHDMITSTSRLWESKPCGIIICARGDQARLFQLPIDTEQYVAVGDSFHLTPALGLLHDDVAFYVLTVTQQHPIVFAGDMYGLQPLMIDLPANIQQALNIDENNQKSEQSLSAGGSSLHTSAFNGRGGARDPREADHMRYFRLIDQQLTKQLDTKRPLVLAGVDTEVAAFRGVSKYPHIVDGSIAGSYGGAKPEDLRDAALKIVQDEIVTPRHLEAIQAFRQAKGTGERAADDTTHLQEAAGEGRIETLLLGMSRVTTDTVHDSLEPRAQLTFSTSNEQVMNDVALKVHNTSGHVLLVDEQTMPDHVPMAGILRY